MKLTDLKPAKGSHKKSFKVGRGPGSGLGKTCGRGQKGAGARKSPHKGSGFEGGQQPLQRRLPKVGFRSRSPKIYQIVNLNQLEKFFSGAVTPEDLVRVGLVKTVNKPIKILGEGQLSKGLQVKANKFSASAQKALEAAGGRAEVI